MEIQYAGPHGIGFIEGLQLVFITLKLCNVIDWAWWVVLLPLEIALAILAIYFIYIQVTDLIDYLKWR